MSTSERELFNPVQRVHAIINNS